MDAAQEWLQKGNILNKNETPNVDQLGPENDIATRAIAHIVRIQDSLPGPDPTGVLSVAVDDMKVLTGLMKLIVVYGIYRCVPDSRMVGLSSRVPTWVLPSKHTDASDAVRLGHDLLAILERNDDVAQLILISPFLVDIFAVMQTSAHDFDTLTGMVPTFNLYKVLIQLNSAPGASPIVAQTLGQLVVLRKDAVRTMIELVTESRDAIESSPDAAGIHKAVLAFSHVPEAVSAKTYIEAFGDQLYTILCMNPAQHKSSVLVHATAVVVDKIASSQPKLVGRLRNLIVSPFISPSGSFSNSSGATLNLIASLRPASSAFVNHLIAVIIPSLWLLICAMESTVKIDTSVMTLLVRCIDYYPSGVSIALMHILLLQKLPNTNLCWSIVSGKEPRLVEYVANQSDNESFLKLLEKRAEILVTVVRQIDDAAATAILVSLMKTYARDENPNQAASPMNKLLAAKAIESLAQDVEVKKKLFSDPREIIEFVFSIVSARTSRLSETKVLETANTSEIHSLNIADSDDEDEDAATTNTEAEPAEDDDLLELALSLLGGALMELMGESQNVTLNQTHKDQLMQLASSTQISKTVRERASFCCELMSGTIGARKEVLDMNDNTAVLEAAYEALREPLVPSRAYGIHLISQLVARHAIDLKEALSIYGKELADDDSYIYLNSIKAIEDAAKANNTDEIIDLLSPLIKCKGPEDLDRSLRAREALVRLLTPRSVSKVSTRLLQVLVSDLRASARNTVDTRLRMSSASIIGIIIAEFPLSVEPSLQSEIADCALGIMRHERDDSDTALRRSVVILCLEIINAVNENAFNNVAPSTVESLVLEITDLKNTTDDDTLRDHCKAVLESTNILA